MQFFDNELVRSQVAELVTIYEDITDLSRSYKFATEEGADEYLKMMTRMLELQEMIYFRAKYSDKEDAQEYIDVINMSLPFVAKEGEKDPSQTFRRMKAEIEQLKKLKGRP